ncbi:uncharacterized protein LOC135835579 [Planococcus citri]|uniref:uncharacterized protein LOC135835579 n=1 Tax=Planococcus citri TaxID=170843 RepID=UPI0031F9B526
MKATEHLVLTNRILKFDLIIFMYAQIIVIKNAAHSEEQHHVIKNQSLRSFTDSFQGKMKTLQEATEELIETLRTPPRIIVNNMSGGLGNGFTRLGLLPISQPGLAMEKNSETLFKTVHDLRNDHSKTLVKLRDEVSEVTNTLSKLDTDQLANEEDKINLARLEDQLETLQKLLDTVNQSLLQRIVTIEQQMEVFKTTLDSFKKDFLKMKTEFENAKLEYEQKILIIECIDEIKIRNFDSAFEKFNQINDDTKISHIVKKVYGDQERNFDLLMEFIERIEKIKQKLLFCNATYHEMIYQSHLDPLKLLQLSRLIKYNHYPGVIQTVSESLINSIRNSMTDAAIVKISKAFLDNHLSDIGSFGKELSDTCFQCLIKIMDKVVHNVVETLPVRTVLGRIRSSDGFCSIQEKIAAYISFYNEIQNNPEMKNTVSLNELSSDVKYITKSDAYHDIHSDIKYQMEQLKNKLPNAF